MASRRSQILDAMVTALSAASVVDAAGTACTKPAGLDVFRTHPAALKASDLPAICVRLAQEEVVKGAGGHKARRTLMVRVDCLVGAADDGETVEDALDALTSWAVQAIGNTATLHGGTGMLANGTTEVVTKWEESDTDAVYGRAAIGFSVDYITAAGNPDTA